MKSSNHFTKFLAGFFAPALVSIYANATGLRHDDASKWLRPHEPPSRRVCEAQDYGVTSRDNRFATCLAIGPQENHQPAATQPGCQCPIETVRGSAFGPCLQPERTVESATARARSRLEPDHLAADPKFPRKCPPLAANIGSRHCPPKGQLTLVSTEVVHG